MADHDGIGDSSDVIDRLENRGWTMEADQGDQTAAERPVGAGATAVGGGDGGEGQQQEVDGGENRRVTKAEPRATKEAGAAGASGLGYRSRGLANSWSPLKDLTRGKGAAVEEEETTEVPVTYREEDILFRPAATATTSSSHIPITKYDVAKHLPDKMLVKLLEDSPMIGEMVLKAKEERARAIVEAEAAERAKREQKEGEELLGEAEVEERSGEEV
ncbi:hypothetical protein RHMOL_Rhmol01G0161800 [Rhododendron molle]|uniref:Uncharacterized protein n=1 Tax=Rhododendron molle TaxID=49168 RepID=A0ACC0Q3M2_RHOML|nr:hypothetical protein RHMOL_Rhmol01G0161800 [Rhododendron molle]